MKIKNLYLNLITRFEEPAADRVEETVETYIEKSEDFRAKYNSANDEEKEKLKEELRQDVKRQLTKMSTQMRKIKNFPKLDFFIRQNIDLVTELGKPLILEESKFRDLCKDCSINPDIETLDIYLDNNTVFCKIIMINKAKVSLALSQKTISVEKYDELMAILDKEK